MKQIFPDLWQTRPEHPFDGLTTHAYLYTHPEGNVLFYSSGHEDEVGEIRQLGGIKAQYLSHRDEAGPALARIRAALGARLYCHRVEEEDARKFSTVDWTFSEREMHPGEIEIIPTPGHTPGSTCFLVRSPLGRRYLFTGDTIFVGKDGAWRGGYISGMSSKPELVESLKLLREFSPDVVLSSASVGSTPFREVTGETWRAAVDEALAGLA